MQRKKILLVDDSETSLMMSRMVLAKANYQLVTAKDGEQGVASAVAERPDLILLDVVMPKMDGFEACRRIRACEELGRVPIIMVTTRGEETNLETGYAAGCTDYVTKPVDALELLTKVRGYLGE